MKSLLRVLAYWLFVNQAFAVQTETFIFISEATPQIRRLEIGNAVTQEIKERAEARDCYHVVLTPGHELIVTITVPEGAKAARLRRQELLMKLNLLKKWLAQVDHGPSDQLSLYGVPETIAYLRQYPDSKCRIVCVGSPVFIEKYYAGTNMIDKNGNGIVPRDGTLQPGSSSPFAPGISALPHGTVATWITEGSLWGANGSKEHRQGLTRFYRLWFQLQNDAILTRFSSSPACAFDFSVPNEHVQLHLSADGDKMKFVSDATSQEVTDKPVNKKVPVTAEPGASVEAKRSNLPGDVWSTYLAKYKRLQTGTAIRLDYFADQSADTSTDIDLRLVDNSTGKEVWYEQNKVPGLGVLMNDIRSGVTYDRKSPQLLERFEFIYVDPHRDLSTCTLWLNKYVGVEEVIGEVSLFVDGKVVGTKPFTFSTRRGDLGADADRRATSENWIRISLSELAE